MPITVEAFSANTNVAFQKMVEESETLKMGDLLSYVCTIWGKKKRQFLWNNWMCRYREVKIHG